jgi:hypothetical protein
MQPLPFRSRRVLVMMEENLHGKFRLSSLDSRPNERRRVPTFRRQFGPHPLAPVYHAAPRGSPLWDSQDAALTEHTTRPAKRVMSRR